MVGVAVAMAVGQEVEGLHSLLQCAAAGVASPLVHAAGAAGAASSERSGDKFTQ